MKSLLIIGKNSKIWNKIKKDIKKNRVITEISHDQLRFLKKQKRFDEIWIFGYSINVNENYDLLHSAVSIKYKKCFYFSSKTTNICQVTKDYKYPMIKKISEDFLKRYNNTYIVRLGLVYGKTSDIPGGGSYVTSYKEIIKFINQDKRRIWYNKDIDLAKLIIKNFSSEFERAVYKLYGLILMSGLFRPILLRPIDLILRLIGWRWYGYFYLSNNIRPSL
jgi:hypothetical protein